MKTIKQLSNILFGTNYITDDFIMPSKKRLIANMYRHYEPKQ